MNWSRIIMALNIFFYFQCWGDETNAFEMSSLEAHLLRFTRRVGYNKKLRDPQTRWFNNGFCSVLIIIKVSEIRNWHSFARVPSQSPVPFVSFLIYVRVLCRYGHSPHTLPLRGLRPRNTSLRISCISLFKMPSVYLSYFLFFII